MRKTNISSSDYQNRACLNSKELPNYLGCGQATANRIALEAGARIVIGKRVLFNRSKLDEYIQRISG